MVKILAVVGAVVVAVLGFGVYQLASAAVAAGAAEHSANVSLESVRADIDGIGTSLSAPNLDTASSDYAKNKQSADDELTRLGQARTMIASDQPRLGSIRDRLLRLDAGLASLPYRSGLDHQRLRIESIQRALVAADTALGIEQSQVKIQFAVYDAFVDLDTLSTRVQKQDITGALAVFPGLDAKLQGATTLGQAPNTPPQIQKALTDLRTFSADMRSYLQAVQRRDRGGALSLSNRLNTDATALQTFDQAGLEAYQRMLMQPYRDRYDSGVRAAGFTPTG